MRKNEEKGRNTGTDTAEHNAVELFLEDVEAQIQYKPAARRISKELYGHLEDKTEEYKSEGLAEEEAMSCAVKDMGDAAALGVMMNDTPCKAAVGIYSFGSDGGFIRNCWKHCGIWKR